MHYILTLQETIEPMSNKIHTHTYAHTHRPYPFDPMGFSQMSQKENIHKISQLICDNTEKYLLLE